MKLGSWGHTTEVFKIMIVPGEASESDEDEHTQSSVPPNVVPILPRSAVAQTPSPTASQGATIASQLTSKVNSVTEAAVKQFGNLSRQVKLTSFTRRTLV